MFCLRKLNCCSKCLKSSQIIVRTLQVSNRKKYVKPQRESTQHGTRAHLQVLGSGAPSQPASVYLHCVDKRYLFNCGEGIGRMSQLVGLSLAKISHAFFTQSKWGCIGGVTSVMFSTVASTGFPPTFNGPNNLQKIFQRMSFLSVIGGIFKHRFTDQLFKNERFEDNKIVIEPVELKHLKDTAIIYVCKLKACPGRFSLKKSLQKNVPAHLVANLFRGEDVTLEDGSVVTKADVMNQDWPDLYFIVVDIPNKGFLKELAINAKLKSQLEKIKATGVEVIVHFTPSKVFNTMRYQDFIERVNPKRNLIVNDSNKDDSVKSVHMLQTRLNKIDPKIHPLLSTKLDINPRIFDPSDESSDKYGKIPMLYSKYILRGEPKEDVELETSSDEESSDFEEILKDLNESPKDALPLCTQEVPIKLKDEKFPRILFLGTGAADSYALRNSSGTLVHLTPDHSILLDCGTATCSQINRYYGDEAPEIYRRLKAVYVSHMHLDHHIGLPELFRWRAIHLPTDRQPLRIFCPLDDLKSWLLFYANHVDPIHFDMKFIDNDILIKDQLNLHERLYLNIESMRTCPTDHYRKSYALALEFSYRNGTDMGRFKLAYSGDIGSSDEFVKLGQNSDLLIHEGTFQSELKDYADRHRHSTIAMALEQSRKMQSKHTILTHFSSRYHIIPYIEGELDANTGIAFDYMEVTPDDFPRLSSLYAKYKENFPSAAEQLERKTFNYLSKSEWE
ncbi:zinc phosphodiesterase ELAC protein 2-like [Sitodiplosis mosellana]|uniref:zinc phosphodiesterase ELAC protein 2-like n=1 Tax=Sitodiplosis mosellana TaxID=263140 RepID=UPI002444469F|nr:zinc phosphodiesterase ELAC protein 2-like [Sitodiplosis mosellana]